MRMMTTSRPSENRPVVCFLNHERPGGLGLPPKS